MSKPLCNKSGRQRIEQRRIAGRIGQTKVVDRIDQAPAPSSGTK